ncbi:MAG TPA: PAS domain-containing protein, partial [Isosphaeraceae bacterium]
LLATTTYTLRLNRSLNRLRRNLAGNQSLRSSIRATSPVAAGVVLVVAALVLVGWVLEVAVLKQVFPGLVAMNPMTAVAFLLAGTGLGLLATGRRIPGAACGVAVAAVGLLKLGEVLLGWGVEVDRWLFRGSLGTNRMAPNTALNLLLSGGALVLLHAEGRRRGAVAQILALATAVVAMLALIGYCYSITTLYGIASFIPMALHTALTFCVLSLGLLHARPDRGLMARITSSGIGSLMARRLMITSIIIPLILGWLGLAGVRIGYYETDFGISLLVLAHVVFFMVLVWWNAGLIDQVDAERQRTDAALRASETFYHSLVESLPQEIVRKDRDGRLTFANQRFCEALGRPREAILGRTDAEILPPGWAERARRDEAEVLQTGAPIDAIEALETPDGATRYIQVIITPQHDSQGAILGTQGIFWDVTRIKEAEAQLRAQNQKLQEMARSERRAHDDLKQAQSRMVETAKLAGLGQMIAGVAHEINNPLSFVSNNVAVLQRDVGELRELVLLYQQADDLLDLHRPELLGRIRDLDARADLPYTLANFD